MGELEKLYALPDAEVEAFRVNPGEALPKLAAKLHYEIFMAMNQGLQMVLPQVIGQVMHQRTEATKVEDKFYGAWPRLKEAVGSNGQAQVIVLNAIKAIRAMNPKMPLDEVIANAGLAAMVTLKIPFDGAPPGSGPTPPPLEAAGAIPAPPPRPPGAGSVGHVPGTRPASGGEESIFSDLAAAHERGEV